MKSFIQNVAGYRLMLALWTAVFIPDLQAKATLEIISDRMAFLRMEESAEVVIGLKNHPWDHPPPSIIINSPLVGGSLILDMQRMDDGEWQATVPLDTSLRQQAYAFSVQLAGDEDAGKTAVDHKIHLVNRRPAGGMPVIMWGLYSPHRVLRDWHWLKDIGFSHVFGFTHAVSQSWEADVPVTQRNLQPDTTTVLNLALIDGVDILNRMNSSSWLNRTKRESLLRIDREGNPHPGFGRPNINARLPGLEEYSWRVGASSALAYGGFPSFVGGLVNSELRQSTTLDFSEHTTLAFEAFSGFPIPDEITEARSLWDNRLAWRDGIETPALEGISAEGVIADDHPHRIFYKWFWKDGDGFNALDRAVHEGLQSGSRRGLWTFHDPATRVPAVWGSADGLDYLSHWSYTYPDPLKIGVATDQLFAMARGAGNEQGVMKMTQLFWRAGAGRPAGEALTRAVEESGYAVDNTVEFFTLAPDHLRIAFWCKLSRPVDGIMYHGWESLLPVEPSAYRYTNPYARNALRELIHSVVQPLGPTLMQVRDEQSEVAVLDSFTTQMFARRINYGRGNPAARAGGDEGWLPDAHIILQLAQLSPHVIYEESIQEGVLDHGIKVLVLADCDVLPKSVVDAIQRFQQNGGIVVADGETAAAVQPDILLPRIVRSFRSQDAARDYQLLVDSAEALRKELDPLYHGRYADSSNPLIVTRTRFAGEGAYVFLVNDHRTFGDYVGHAGRTMEVGLPASAKITVATPGASVYDLVQHSPVVTDADGVPGYSTFPVDLEPAGGGIYLVLPSPIEGIRCDLDSNKITPGNTVNLTIEIFGPGRQPVDAVIPVQVDVRDPDNSPAEVSGYYAAANGRLALALDIAPNDTIGTWTLSIRELASGREYRQTFSVTSNIY